MIALIKLLIVIAVLVLYSLFARAALPLIKAPTTFNNVILFVVSGGIGGGLTLVVYGTILAETRGHLGEEPQLLGMISTALVVAALCSVITSYLVHKNRSH